MNRKQKKIPKANQNNYYYFKINKTVLSVTLFLTSLVLVYFTGYINAISDSQKIIDNFYNRGIDNSVNGLYNTTINDIKIFSDVNNFTRIERIINELGLTKNNYHRLTGIIYYQNLSEFDGYNEHLDSMSCDGSYDIIGKFVTLYRCDGTMVMRGFDISKENSEKFILLHELGHYEVYENYEFQQKVADAYAEAMIK